MPLTPEESAALKNAEIVVAELKKKAAAESRTGGGGGATSDLAQRKADAAEFDHLSRTGGLTELFDTDRATFDRLKEAKETLGRSELLGRNRISQVP
jgi:hypothetical protein